MIAFFREIRGIIGAALLLGASAVADDVSGEAAKIAGGFGFTEGPVWHAKEQALYFSDLKTRTIHRWSEEAGVTVWRAGGAMPNGLALHPDGRLFICEPGERRVVWRNSAGESGTVIDRLDGRRLGNPNDLWISADGGCHISIPRMKNAEDNESVHGVILYVAPDGAARIASGGLDLKSANGVTGCPDGESLYYTNRGKVWKARIAADGGLSAPVVAAAKGWDGLALDLEGNIHTTGEEGVEVYGADATRIGLVRVPEAVANFCIGGPHRRTLFIAARTGLYRFELPPGR